MSTDSLADPSRVIVEFACLRARQPIGEIFVGTISHTDLAKMTFFDVRRRIQADRDVEKYLGVQRPLDNQRVKQLQEYVTYIDASFPSSIIIALPEEYVSYDESARKMQVRNYRDYETMPSIAIRGVARVLDGQHRIAGLEEFEGQFDLTLTILVGADISDQAHIFATVNLEQTKVNRSLVYDLYELSRSRSPQKSCHNVVVALDRDPESPFYNRVKRLGLATEGKDFQPVTQQTLVEGLLPYISEDPKRDRDEILRGHNLELIRGNELNKRPLRNLFILEKDISIVQIIYNYFSAVADRWPEAWTTRERGFILNRANGIRALLKFFGDAYLGVAKPGEVVSKDRFLEEIFSSVPLNDSDFTIENFAPGSSGEAKLRRILRREEELSGPFIRS